MYITLNKNVENKLEAILTSVENAVFFDDIQLITLWKQYWIKNFLNIFRHYCENKSLTYTKTLKNTFNISDRDLSQLELYSVWSGFSKRSLNNLQYAYRKYSKYMDKQKIPYFYIAIPVANRDRELNNLLKSIYDELKLFGYPINHVIVNIFNDGTNDIVLNNNFEDLHIKVRNIDDQISFLHRNYEEENLKKIQWIFINDLNVRKSLKWSAVTMNIARLILNKYIKETDSLVRFIDSDQDFSILTKKNNAFYKIPHAFSIFHGYYKVFLKKDIIFATWSVVWDPAFSAPLMLRTQLIDVRNAQKKKKINLNNFKYFHDNFAFYDLNIFTNNADNKNSAFPYLPYISNNRKIFHPFFDILFWHHVTRPMLYDLDKIYIMKNWWINRNIGTMNIVRPWNFIFRKEWLKYPTLFACEKIRIHWPIFWFILNNLWQKIYKINCPCFHDRAFNKNSINQWYRWWTNIEWKYINLSDLWMKQIEWDIILEYLKKIKFRSNNILWDLDEEVYNECYMKVIKAHIDNIKQILKIIKDINKNKRNEILIESINLTISCLNLNLDKESIKNEIIQLSKKLNKANYDLDLRFNIINS